VLNMFRTLIYPSSGAWDYSVEIPHWSYCSWFDVCWSFGVAGLGWYPCSRLKSAIRIPPQTQPHRNSNTHRTKNNTTNVAIQQISRKFLMMDILMPEACWTHKKWNKIASDIKLVFYSSTTSLPLAQSHEPSGSDISYIYIYIYTLHLHIGLIFSTYFILDNFNCN